MQFRLNHLLSMHSNPKCKEEFSLTREELIERLYEDIIIKYSEIGINEKNLENHDVKAIIEREVTIELGKKYVSIIKNRINKVRRKKKL